MRDFSILIHDGVMARTYLAMLRAAGFKPPHGILIVPTHREGGRPIGRFLPAPLRMSYARRRHDAAAMYWPRRLQRTQRALFLSMTGRISERYGLPAGFYADTFGRFDYANYVDRVHVAFVHHGVQDPLLSQSLDRLPLGPILFTGGGILPASLVTRAAQPFIHVHPGLLPAIRGADGLLWSTALLGRPTASCMVMAPGLDVGDLLGMYRYDELAFPMQREARPDDQTLYRMIYAFYDPVIRARALTDLLLRHQGDWRAAAAAAVPQDLEQGLTYHFMHPRLRSAVLRRIFPDV